MVPKFVNNIINTIFLLFFSGLDEFFKRFGTWLTNLAWLVLIVLLLISMQGVRELEALLVQLSFFYLCVFIVHLFLWPKKMPNNPFPDVSKSFQLSIKRILFYGIPVMIFFWLLVSFGMVDQLRDTFSASSQYFTDFEMAGQLGDIFSEWSQYFAKKASEYYNLLINLQSLSIPNTDFVIPGGVVLVGGVFALILLIRRLVGR
jgi:hypothetical protein